MATMTKIEMQQIVDKAAEAGMAAMSKTQTTPMIVGRPTNLVASVTSGESDIDFSKPVYYAPQGPCGMAWINVKPGNSRFANFLKAQKIARPDKYEGGVIIWVSAGGQSYQLKKAYAAAYAGVLREHGINANSNSRMD